MKPSKSFKVLIVSPSWVGDLVMSQSLLRQLNSFYPGIQIDVLAPAWAKPLLERMPEVKTIHTMPITHHEFKIKERWKIGRRFKEENYQEVFVLPNSWKSALIPFFANIPRRIGWLGEQRWLLLNNTKRLNKRELPLMAQRFQALAFDKFHLHGQPLLPPRLEINKINLEETLNRLNLDLTRPILAMCPGAEYGPAKRWPAKYFAEVALQKIKRGWSVWLLGSEKEKPMTAEIQELTNHECYDLAGKTNLGEVVDLLSKAQCVISNDTGLMHIAAAVEKPIIVLYGSSSPGFTPPLTTRAKALSLNLKCSPCFKRECPLGHMDCLEKLMPQQVLETLEQL